MSDREQAADRRDAEATAVTDQRRIATSSQKNAIRPQRDVIDVVVGLVAELETDLHPDAVRS